MHFTHGKFDTKCQTVSGKQKYFCDYTITPGKRFREAMHGVPKNDDDLLDKTTAEPPRR